jgi:hypothetical protein
MKDCKTCAELVESLKVAAALIKQAKAQITELRIDLNFMKYDNRNLQAQLVKQSNRLSNRDAQVATAQSLLSQQQRRERLMQIQPNKGITEKGEIQADMIASAIEQALAAPAPALSKRSKRLGSEG